MAENAVLVGLGMALCVEVHMLQAPILRTIVGGKEVVDYSVTTWLCFRPVRLRCGAFRFLPPALLSVVFCCTCSLCLYLQDWKGFAQLRGGLNPGLTDGASLPARKLPMVRG